MAKRTRNTLKGYFETGDIPSQAQYHDLIDSNLNLLENNTGDIQLTGNITASGAISASGTIRGTSISFEPGMFIRNDAAPLSTGAGNIFFSDGIQVSGNVTASGNITASRIEGNDIFSKNTRAAQFDGQQLLLGDTSQNTSIVGQKIFLSAPVTASGDITASGNIIGATGSFDNGIILTAPNGNKFRFVVNNSGHLSITGSAI